MVFPAQLEIEISDMGKAEFEAPSHDFGERVMVAIKAETDQDLDPEVMMNLNDWQDLFVGPEFSWGDFIRWLVAKIIKWWDELWA